MGSACILSIALPYTGDAERDLRVFHESWISLAEKNVTLLSDLKAAVLLGHPRNPILEAASAELSSKLARKPVLQFTDETWGRVFNDAFLYALASDSAGLWVHIDDAHLCTRPFWHSACSVLGSLGRDLWQLQLSYDSRQHSWGAVVQKDGYSQLLMHPEEEDCGEGWSSSSLKPFVMNLQKFRAAVQERKLSCRPFEEDADWEEMQWSFYLELQRLGAEVGALSPTAFHTSFSDLYDEDM
jgi:hypothetical protein